MPALRDPRHEIFAQQLAAGKSKTQAYIAAGYAHNPPNATRFAKIQGIKDRVEELLEARGKQMEQLWTTQVRRSGITRQSVLERLNEIIDRCMEKTPITDAHGRPTGNYRWLPTAALRGLEMLGKELGMFVDKRHLSVTSDLDKMTDDQLSEHIAFLEREAGIRARSPPLIDATPTVSGTEQPAEVQRVGLADC